MLFSKGREKVETKKVDYVKVRGIIAIIVFIVGTVLSKIYKLDDYDESIQVYIIFGFIFVMLFSIYFGMKYFLRFYKQKDGTYYK